MKRIFTTSTAIYCIKRPKEMLFYVGFEPNEKKIGPILQNHFLLEPIKYQATNLTVTV
jgi:hypothetical protein